MESVLQTGPQSQVTSEPVSTDSSETTVQKARNISKRKLSRNFPDLPKNEHGQIDKRRVKEIFFASPFVEWTPFAQNQGWDADRTRVIFPTIIWCDEKRKQQFAMQEENVRQVWFDTWQAFSKDVGDTLKRYPKMADTAAFVAMSRINYYAKLAKEEPARFHKEVATSTICTAITALSIAQQTKYKALMLDQYTLKQIADKAAKSEVASAGTERDDWSIDVIGEGKISTKRLQEIMTQYYDRPLITVTPDDEPMNES